MSDAGERVSQVPEGAKAVTAKDVISKAVPIGFEDVEYYLIISTAGIKETVRIRPNIGERFETQQSPLDGSFLMLHFVFKSGDDKNEQTGEQFFPVNNIFSWSRALLKEAIYKDGESPAELEMKRRELARQLSLQEKAAKLNAGLDDLDE